MPLGPRHSDASSADYRAAIAQWRLALRTEVKRCSSLPSSMFDACDPALETHLAATAEAVLISLLATEATPDEHAPGEAQEQRRERVSLDELRRLPQVFATMGTDAPDFEAGLQSEYLAILKDLCCTAAGEPLLQAVELLERDFGLSDLDELHTLRNQHQLRSRER